MSKADSPEYRALLMKSATRILLSDPRKDEGYVNSERQDLDSESRICSNRVSVRPIPATKPSTFKENTMAKASKSQPVTQSATSASGNQTPKNGETITHTDGSTETLNPKPALASTGSKKEALAKQKAEIAEQKAKAKAEKDAQMAAKAEAKAVLKAQKEAAKLERQERLASLGRNYTGSMLALADAVKSGKYVKSATGQLRSTNELATVLDGVTPNGVIQTAKAVLGLEVNPYTHLNVGQQSMNLRNKMRGAITKGTLGIDTIREYIAANGLDVSGEYAAKREAKAAAKIKREADATAKKEAQEKAKAEKAAAESKAE